jgi:hypothetical protein
MHVEAPTPDDWPRIADLVKQYDDFPFGGVDASIVVLAERLDIETVVTLDDRHFRAVRLRHRKAFRLLPCAEPHRSSRRARPVVGGTPGVNGRNQRSGLTSTNAS